MAGLLFSEVISILIQIPPILFPQVSWVSPSATFGDILIVTYLTIFTNCLQKSIKHGYDLPTLDHSTSDPFLQLPQHLDSVHDAHVGVGEVVEASEGERREQPHQPRQLATDKKSIGDNKK